ncbi:hypothetical protein A0H81_04477 [Grifola frondosa]|uniref:Arrestin-like N-terminal domain-containing protein n=1 Tax=Grifola frondosa TaxID=5627 RepID=A0A1C7MFG5_GRIFR|nr:hypothetical protein A0H81_04477 [Grifola frondosa]
MGCSSPTYGLDAMISGVVKFRKACNYVVEMTLTLRGAVNTSASQHATVAIPGINKTQLMQKKMTLFSASPCRSALAQGEFPFNIQFPPGISADVTYSLQVDIVRKGLRRHEMVNVPLLYLPKSRPYTPPLCNIPLLHPGSSRNERVKIIDLSASWPARSDTCSASQADLPLISLALPSPACFASGDTIPLSICILCPYSPALAELLTYNIGLFLIRRKKTWVSAGRQVAVSEQMVSRAAVFLVDGSQEGTAHLRLELRAGEHGRECSWQVDKTVAVEHAIRVVVRPQSTLRISHLSGMRSLLR